MIALLFRYTENYSSFTMLTFTRYHKVISPAFTFTSFLAITLTCVKTDQKDLHGVHVVLHSPFLDVKP